MVDKKLPVPAGDLMGILIKTADGSHTVFVPELKEHYHSVNGALTESNHVFIKNGFDFCTADPVNIFEVGFGTGLNAYLTALKSRVSGKTVYYTSVEKHPLPPSMLKELNYPSFTGENGEEVFNVIHRAPWNTSCCINNNFILKKIVLDLITAELTGCYQIIYFDAFGPDKQPEMWSREIFEKIASVTAKGGILVTYSAKGEVKRNLRACGFEVALLSGAPGKRHMIRAMKI
jgi:tRNA U34 5-methylaminomethyl-2-thiouridine-forming methyltransferase MnmC